MHVTDGLRESALQFEGISFWRQRGLKAAVTLWSFDDDPFAANMRGQSVRCLYSITRSVGSFGDLALGWKFCLQEATDRNARSERNRHLGRHFREDDAF